MSYDTIGKKSSEFDLDDDYFGIADEPAAQPTLLDRHRNDLERSGLNEETIASALTEIRPVALAKFGPGCEVPASSSPQRSQVFFRLGSWCGHLLPGAFALLGRPRWRWSHATMSASGKCSRTQSPGRTGGPPEASCCSGSFYFGLRRSGPWISIVTHRCRSRESSAATIGGLFRYWTQPS